MKDGVEIKSIKLNLGGREIELSIEEARKLKKALEDIFGREIIRVIEDRWHFYPQLTEPYTPKKWPYDIWCDSSKGNENKHLCLSIS